MGLGSEIAVIVEAFGVTKGSMDCMGGETGGDIGALF